MEVIHFPALNYWLIIVKKAMIMKVKGTHYILIEQ